MSSARNVCVPGVFAINEVERAFSMKATNSDLRDTILKAWKTNNRVTVFLVEQLPTELWGATVPGAPRRTVRMIAGHIHNARCTWIKTLGNEHGIVVPRTVNRHKVGPKELLPALRHSSRGIIDLLTLGFDRGGTIPTSS